MTDASSAEGVPHHSDIYVAVGAVIFAGFFGVGMAYLLDEPPIVGVVAAVWTSFMIMVFHTHYPTEAKR